ncbi:MAG: hypothetical protein ACRERV_08715 [Methylococcales bacterium]
MRLKTDEPIHFESTDRYFIDVRTTLEPNNGLTDLGRRSLADFNKQRAPQYLSFSGTVLGFKPVKSK